MASYHCKIRNISRGADGNGKSSVASAAYRAGENLYNEREGKGHYFQNRGTDILFKKIKTGSNAPDWSQDRCEFWNRTEIAERYKNARTAKEIILSLPYELNRKQFISVAEQFVEDTIISKHGISADINIHRYGRAKKPDAEEVEQWKDKGLPFLVGKMADRSDKEHVKVLIDAHGAITGYKLYQPHAHIMMPLRGFDENSKSGFAKKKNRAIDSRNQILLWRKAWQDIINKQFERMNLNIRLSCLSKIAANDNNQPDSDNDTVEDFSYAIYEEVKQEEESRLQAASENKGGQVNLKQMLESSNDNISASDSPEISFIEQQNQVRLRQAMLTNHLALNSADEVDRMFQAWAMIHDREGGLNR